MKSFFKRQRSEDRLSIAPSMDATLKRDRLLLGQGAVDHRVIKLSIAAVLLAVVAALVAQFLTHLIGFFTNLFFFQRFSLEFVSPHQAPNWGWWIIPIPVVGGIIIGLMARYGSMAIRGHGIPEAMEQILTNQSRIPLRVTFLKPLSAAISIGTGGPFGAEGPIIATGAALGSVLGQFLRTAASSRKCLLAAGAAAGMTATFGSPISAVLLAVELLLFEFRPQSLIPVALAAAVAQSVRIFFEGSGPVFPMPTMSVMPMASILFFIVLGIFMGVVSVGTTKVVYLIEDAFERLPIHWMWWPALGGLAVGLIGYFHPSTMGVGYENIEAIVSGRVVPTSLAVFCLWKFISWSLSLGSGTSGGTLAPLFMIGGGIGALAGFATAEWAPGLGITPAVAGLVGMAAIFAGASRALLASVVFAFEVTQQPLGLMPLLAGCCLSYLVSGYLMKNSIMTEKIARRGVVVPNEYEADHLAQTMVKDVATRKVQKLFAEQKLEEVRDLLLNHRPPFIYQGYPVVDRSGKLLGVVTRKELLRPDEFQGTCVGDLIEKELISIEESRTLRQAADLMLREKVGRLPVVSKDGELTGIISRSDLM